MTTHREDREEFLATLARELPDAPLPAVLEYGRKILRAARTLQRLAEYACNREQDAYWERGTGRAKVALAKAVAALADWQAKRGPWLEFGITEIGGDPRGYVVKLRLPSGRGNTWGGCQAGWGVPA